MRWMRWIFANASGKENLQKAGHVLAGTKPKKADIKPKKHPLFSKNIRDQIRTIFTRVSFQKSLNNLNEIAQKTVETKIVTTSDCQTNQIVESKNDTQEVLAPTLQEVEEFCKVIAKERQTNPELDSALKKFLQDVQNPDVMGIAILAKLDKKSDQTINNSSALLLFSSLLREAGLESGFVEGDSLGYIPINSKFREEFLPHQDSHIDKNTNQIQMLKYQAIISGFSNSQMITYTIESKYILEELKSKNLLDLLKKERFDIDLGDRLLQGHILIKTDKDGRDYFDEFVGGSKYMPQTDDEEKKDKMLRAIELIKNYARLSHHKNEFILNNGDVNNEGVQMLFFCGKHCLHGRHSAPNPTMSEIRNIFGIGIRNPKEQKSPVNSQ